MLEYDVLRARARAREHVGVEANKTSGRGGPLITSRFVFRFRTFAHYLDEVTGISLSLFFFSLDSMDVVVFTLVWESYARSMIDEKCSSAISHITRLIARTNSQVFEHEEFASYLDEEITVVTANLGKSPGSTSTSSRAPYTARALPLSARLVTIISLRRISYTYNADNEVYAPVETQDWFDVAWIYKCGQRHPKRRRLCRPRIKTKSNGKTEARINKHTRERTHGHDGDARSSPTSKSVGEDPQPFRSQ